MKYIRVKWIHDLRTEPVLIYSELDELRWEKRKVEIFHNGDVGIADKSSADGLTQLSLEPIPSVQAIALDPQFEPMEISSKEFEKIWNEASEKFAGG